MDLNEKLNLTPAKAESWNVCLHCGAYQPVATAKDKQGSYCNAHTSKRSRGER